MRRSNVCASCAVHRGRWSDYPLDDDAFLGTKNTSDKLGTIEVLVMRCEGFSVATEPFRASKFDDIGPIHEKSKKAGVHAVTYESNLRYVRQCSHIASFHSLGDVKSIQCVTYLKDFGTEKEPCARFVFRYRPIGNTLTQIRPSYDSFLTFACRPSTGTRPCAPGAEALEARGRIAGSRRCPRTQ